MVTARPCDAKSRGACNLIESIDSGSAPPDALVTVVVVIALTPSILDGAENDDAPLDAVLFVTTYLSMTTLPSDNALLTTPSPK